MKLSPLDLKQVQFRRVFRGVDELEVRRFLDLVRTEMEALRRENEALKDELQQALRRLAEYREKEGVLREALLTAQKVGDDLRHNAEQEAELIVRDAEMKASRHLSEAMHRVQSLRDEIIDLRQQKQTVRVEVKALIDRAQAWLEVDEAADAEAAERESGIHFFAPPQSESGRGA